MIRAANTRQSAARAWPIRNTEFLAFLWQVERTYRDVLDDQGEPVTCTRRWTTTPPTSTRREDLAGRASAVQGSPDPRLLDDLVWFGIVERQAIRRGVFKSVNDVNAKIRAFIDGRDDRARPFVWTKTAEEVLAKANRPTTQVRRTSGV